MDELDDFHEMSKRLGDQAEEIGLYLRGFHVQSSANPEEIEEGKTPRQLIEAGEEFIVHARFQIGEVAFSQRIQDPEGFAAEQEFQLAVPTETEIMAQAILEKGKSGELFDLSPIEEETDGDEAG